NAVRSCCGSVEVKEPPPPPWQCTSTKPGTSQHPDRSTVVAPGAAAPVRTSWIRPSDTCTDVSVRTPSGVTVRAPVRNRSPVCTVSFSFRRARPARSSTGQRGLPPQLHAAQLLVYTKELAYTSAGVASSASLGRAALEIGRASG